MSKTTISKIILAGLPFALCASVGANASAKDFTVNTATELIEAVAEIQEGENAAHKITLGSDITFTSSDGIDTPILLSNKNKVTIYGNNHTIVFGKDDNKIILNDASLNLGGDSKTLKISGGGSSVTANDPLITVTAGSVLNMTNGVTLSDNYGTDGTLGCGGVMVLDGSTFNMNGGVIENNHASEDYGYGGAINVDGQSAKLNITGGIIRNNTAGIYGGAIYANDAHVTIKNSTFTENQTPDGYGGAIVLFEGATATIEDSEFTKNSAGNYPGAIANFCSVMTVTRSIFTENTSGSWGGAIMTGCDDDVATTNIKDSVFHKNSADAYGGAIMLLSGSLSSEGSTYSENESYLGGAIFSAANLALHGDTFTGNAAEDYGGAIYISDGDADLAGSMIYNNKAETGANDIFAADSINSLILPDATEMGGTATFNSTEVEVDGWYTDADNDRYAPDNITDEVTEYTEGEYLLITAGKGNKVKLSFDGDGDDSTPLRIKFLPIGAKIKLDANGGEVEEDELVVEENIEVPDPIYKDHDFTGWNPDEVEGYNYALKASWDEVPTEEAAGETDGADKKSEDVNPDAPDTIDIVTLSAIMFSLCAVGFGVIAGITKKSL